MFKTVILGLIFLFSFLFIKSLGIEINGIVIVIFIAIILLAILLSARKKINWTVIWIVLALFLLYGALVFLGLATIAETEQRAEMNAFRVESSAGVSINSGNNYLVATGGKEGGKITMVSEERNPPCVQFNFSGGNSTFEVSIGGVLYGEAYRFSKPAGVFNTCHHRAKDGDNQKKIIKIEIVVKHGDTIRITNYRVWEKY